MKKIILLLLIFSLTGCYNYNELNNLAIATGFAIDIKDDEYELTILISNSQKKGSKEEGNSAKAAVYKGTGKTIFSALKDASTAISKQIYVSHIEVLVLSSEVAKTKTSEVIDFFFRYPQTRNEFYLVLASNCKASDVFDVTTPLETFPSQNISKNLEITDKLQGYTYTVTFNEFIKGIIEEGSNPLLPTIEIIGNTEIGNKEDNIEQIEPSTYLKLGMMSIFNGFNLVGISNKEQSKGINIANNKVRTTLIHTKYNNENIVVELNEAKVSKSVVIKNNIPKFKINIKTEGSIAEVSGNVSITDVKVIDEIKKNSEEEIKHLVNEAINYSKENKTDIFSFGNLVYKKNPKLWKSIEDKWESEMLNDIEVEIVVDLDLKTKGSIENIIEVN